MMEIIEFVFSGFWVFIGSLMIIALPIKFVLKMYNRTWRHWNIRKHGYPPAHCDADGDFKKEES